MSDVTVKQLAEVVGTPVDRLLTQLAEAGIQATNAESPISDDDKMKLLAHLRTRHGKGEGGASPKKKITLKRKSVSEIKLGGRGAGKTVSVEVRKKRTYVKRDETPEQEAPVAAAPVTPPVSKLEELAKQLDAETEAMRRSYEEENAEAKRKAEEEAAAKKAEEEARLAEEARIKAEEEKLKAEQEAAAKAEEEKLKAEQAAKEAQAAAEAKPADSPTENRRIIKPPTEQDKARAAAAKNKNRARQKASAPAGASDQKTRYGRDQLHVAADKSGRRRKKKGGRRQPQVESTGKHGFEKPTAPVIREVEIGETITVGDLAQGLALKASEVVKVLMGMGVMATINQALDQDTATLVTEELGHKVKLVSEDDVEQALVAASGVEDDDREKVTRPPVVTIMGHVDHGKTSLLDYIRNSRVVSDEAGGITQHIGAYHVDTSKGGISFVDTPGHAAFTAMRARGAQVTDIVILVVAADDGVMPQTVEAVKHAQAAEVPIIVAVNKIDKEEADPDRVKNELTKYEIVPEDWGGDTQFVNVSAKTGEGIDKLLDAIDLQAELMELKAPATGPASGTVLEASLDKGRGPVATILVQAGELKKGDIVLCGEYFGRVRALFMDGGSQVQSAGPSMPVAVLGLSGTPSAGDDMLVVKNERQAREVAETRRAKAHEARLAQQQAARLENLFSQMKDGERSSVTVLVKADVQGSAEALKDALTKLSTDEVHVNVVSSGVGGISETDVNLAVASGAIIIGFNVRAEGSAKRLIEEHNVDLRYYSVIYDAIDDVKAALSGLLAPEVREEIVGLAEVQQVFKSSAMGPVAGCIVTEGVVKRGNPIRVLRDNTVIYEGELESLRRHRDDVSEVRMGTECGIAVKNYNDVRPGDLIENFERTLIKRTL